MKNKSEQSSGDSYYDPALGASRPVGRYRTAAQEKADEKREIDVPLTRNFHRGQKVQVDRAWRRHWTFQEAPRPTQQLWGKLFTQEGVVAGIDDFGNIWIQDYFGQMHGDQGFPVPARFVKPA